VPDKEDTVVEMDDLATRFSDVLTRGSFKPEECLPNMYIFYVLGSNGPNRPYNPGLGGLGLPWGGLAWGGLAWGGLGLAPS
jgi:hypothetical protein